MASNTSWVPARGGGRVSGGWRRGGFLPGEGGGGVLDRPSRTGGFIREHMVIVSCRPAQPIRSQQRPTVSLPGGPHASTKF
jgi:hypothetical protein